MNINKQTSEYHSYKVIQNLNNLSNSAFPKISIEITEQATIEDHLYAFERFLQGLGYVLPENSHLDFVENDIESDRDEDLTVTIDQPSNHINNGVN